MCLSPFHFPFSFLVPAILVPWESIMAAREFHFQDGTSNKFWTIELGANCFLSGS